MLNEKQMKKNILAFLLLVFVIELTSAQEIDQSKIDSLVSGAISLSEEYLYDARFEEAKDLVQLSYFKNLNGYVQKHEIMLIIQDLRVERFMNIVYQQQSDHIENFEILYKLLPYALKMQDRNVQGNYFLALAIAYESLGNLDSVLIYEEKAATIYTDTRNFKKLAGLRATRISRKHNQLSLEGKKKEILALIPEYEEEIKFSSIFSKDTKSYNTRHLAQIYRRQTLNYKEALRLFELSLSLREEIGFKPFIPASYSSLGDVYSKMGNYKLAIEMYSKSAELAEEIGFVPERRNMVFLKLQQRFFGEVDRILGNGRGQLSLGPREARV